MSKNVNIEQILKQDYLTIGQLAASLGWSTRFIEGLVRSERLPGLEVDGVWRFRRDDVIDWLEQKIQTLDSARITELEAKMESSLVADGTFNGRRIDRLASYLPTAGIALDRKLANKAEVLLALTELAYATGLVFDKDYLHASLVDRESLCSTALPGGLAICHPRRPVPSAIGQQFLCFLRAASPVDFGADDGEPTSIFFLLCAPDDRSHLHGLARLARLLQGNTITALKTVDTVAGIIETLSASEQSAGLA